MQPEDLTKKCYDTIKKNELNINEENSLCLFSSFILAPQIFFLFSKGEQNYQYKKTFLIGEKPSQNLFFDYVQQIINIQAGDFYER